MTLGRFRQDYDGEFVILETKIINGTKTQRREWVPNPIINQHISGRAAVIGSNVDRDLFDYSRLQRHKGGLKGKKRLQTYGCNDTWQTIKCDFYITTDHGILNQLHQTNYHESTAVYSTVRGCLTYPGDFYFIPYSPVINDLAVAVYIAAFDGHSEVFLIGYNNETPATSNTWQRDVEQVITAYPNTQFILVGVQSNMPDAWRNHRNVRCMDHRSWVSYCDV
jgi:hypothetical protein